jgi:uncharacterized membrane-anchored protein
VPAGISVIVGLGDHPRRTPFYGVLLVIGACLLVWLAASAQTAWLSVPGYLLAVAVGAFGFVMTLRDYDDFPHWRH